MNHLWAIVGTGVRPQEETDFVVLHLFDDPDGFAAAVEMDEAIGALPGMHGCGIFRAARVESIERADRVRPHAPGMWRAVPAS
jgi:hypothetical protein